MRNEVELSIIVPVYNAESSIADLCRKVAEVFAGRSIELVLVNDGSSDGSARICRELAENLPIVAFVDLRRNFGEHNAVMCGLNYASGRYVAIIDDDFQNPPEEVDKLLAAAADYDVVYSYYRVKHHNPWRNFLSAVNDRMANWLLQKPPNLYLSSFKLIKREIVDEIIKYRGPFPYVDGLILRATANIGTAEVQHAARRDGRSNYTPGKLLNLWLNMFINFSIVPVRAFTLCGLVIFVLGILLSLLVVLEWILEPGLSPGWASQFIASLLLNGFQIVFCGLLGEFLGKQYLDQNGTPQWVVKGEYGKARRDG